MQPAMIFHQFLPRHYHRPPIVPTTQSCAFFMSSYHAKASEIES